MTPTREPAPAPENEAKGDVLVNANRSVVLPKSFLTDEELGAVQRLAELCNAFEGLDLKLALNPAPDAAANEPAAFLCYAEDGDLAGFCSLDGVGEIEVCGMVHPEHRRQGIGAKLLVAARVACMQRGATQVLLICEDASRSGRAFVAARGASRRFGEHRMVLTDPSILSGIARLDDSLALLRVTAEDKQAVETLIDVRAAVFDEDYADAIRRITQDLHSATERYYLAYLDDEPVGCLKLVYEGHAAGIYAFGVPPKQRKQGIGKRILARAAATAHADGYQRIWLEVEQENVPALALYRSSGFRETTVYGYYELPLHQEQHQAVSADEM